jgi:hypothetical protein
MQARRKQKALQTASPRLESNKTADEGVDMELRKQGAAKRLIFSLAAAALSGCVYGPPPYAAYDQAPGAAPYYYSPYAYGYPTYVGPPLSLSFGFYEHSYHGGHGHYGGHGYYGGHGGHGHGWGGGHGYHGGGHGGHGRH